MMLKGGTKDALVVVSDGWSVYVRVEGFLQRSFLQCCSVVPFDYLYPVLYLGVSMKVYLKNELEQQTVRDLNFIQALKLRLWVWMRYPKNERPIVRFVI